MKFAVEWNLAEDFAAIGFEGGAEVVNIYATQLGHQPVGAARGNAAHPEIVDAILAPAANNIVALGNFFEKKRNVGGIVLQVAVHGDDIFASGMIESGSEAGRLAKVAAQLNDGHAAIDGGDFFQQGEWAVDGSVIDQHHLEHLAARLHQGLKPRVEIGGVLLLVVQGNYDGIFEHCILLYGNLDPVS